MNNLTNQKSLKEQLESYLDRACQAEAEGNYAEAERLFRLSLYCEGLSRPDVGNAQGYARQAGQVYPGARLHVEQGIIREHNETEKTK